MNEIWKNIEGYDGLYEISNYGRVKRLCKSVTNSFGTFISKEIILNGNISKRGYVKQTLTKNGKGKTYLIHRLVAQAYLPNLESKEMVNHINGIKSDNKVSNLEWCTGSENIQHALDTKLLIPRKGSNIYFSKFIEKDVSIILYKCLVNKINPNVIAKELNTNNRTITDMIKRRTWKHIECPKYLTNEDLEYYNKLVIEGNIKSKISTKLKTDKIEYKTLETIWNLLK